MTPTEENSRRTTDLIEEVYTLFNHQIDAVREIAAAAGQPNSGWMIAGLRI